MKKRSDRRVDVAVLGGGPAGATAALLLASWGRRVLLLSRLAARPPLAESLPPSCDKLLERVGLRRAVDAAGFVRSTGNTVRWGADAERVERFPGGALGYQVSRDAFDRLLLAEAAAAGASVRRGAVVRDVRDAGDAGEAGDAGDGALVTYEAGAEQRRVRARWVLDCTGRAGLLARREWRRAEPGLRTMAIVGVWERRGRWRVADETHTLVESYEGGWAWSVPVSRSRRYVTVMVDPALTTVAGRTRLASTYREELARTPGLRALVEGATLTGPPFARDASSYSAAHTGRDGLLLVGDAASFVDPLSSYGVKKALASAWLAAVVTNACLADAALLGPALELYEARERAIYESLRRQLVELSRTASQGHAGDFWQGRADADEHEPEREPDVAALRADPEVLAALEELKRRPSVVLCPAPQLRRVKKAVVRGNGLVLEEHLVAPAFREGVRYIRSVDLATIAALAPAHDQVPDLFDAYNRAAPPVALPDFLGALSVMVGKGMLTLA